MFMNVKFDIIQTTTDIIRILLSCTIFLGSEFILAFMKPAFTISRKRILRQYRAWLKLAVKFPKSMLVQMNSHTQMSEKAIVIVRQRFRENLEVRDSKKIRVLVQEGERSLTMMKRLTNNIALKQNPPLTQPPLNYFSMVPLRKMLSENVKAYCKEFYFNYVSKRW